VARIIYNEKYSSQYFSLEKLADTILAAWPREKLSCGGWLA